jgi:tape measure domain-containing protein
MSGILLDVQTRTSQAEKDLANINRSLKNIDKSTTDVSSSLKEMFLTLGGTAAVGLGLNYVKEISTSFKELENKVALVTGRNKELIKTQEELYKISEATRVSIKSTTDVYASLGRSLASAGISNTRILKTTETIQKAIAMTGGSATSAAAAITQLGQGLSSGTLRGEELNSVLEQAPRLAKAITDELDISTGQLRKLAAEGQVTSDVVFKALESQAAKISSEFAVTSVTAAQAGESLTEAIQTYIYELDKGLGLSERLSGTALDISHSIRKASFDAFELGNSFAIVFHKFGAAAQNIGKPILTMLSAVGKQAYEIFPKVFFGRTLIQDVNSAFRFIDDKVLNLFSSFLGFKIINVISIRSDVEDAITILKRLSPRSIFSKGFDADYIKYLFNEKSLREYGIAFNILAKAIAGNTASISSRLDRFTSNLIFNLRFLSNYFGLTNDLFVIKPGLLSNFLGTLNQMIRGVTGLSIKFYELNKLFNFYFMPGLAALKDTFSDIGVAIKDYFIDNLIEAKLIISDFFKAIYEKSNLNSALTNILSFSKNVIEAFFQIYDQVIGHSWWTDTVENVKETSANLWNNSKRGVLDFKDKVSSTFEAIYSGTKELFSSDGLTLRPEVKKKIVNKVEDIGLNFSADSLVSFFKSFGENLNFVFKTTFEQAPDILKSILSGFGLILTSLLFPPSGIKLIIEGALLSSFIKSSTFLTEELTNAFANESLVGAAFNFVGELAGKFVASFIESLPALLNALSVATSRFITGFVKELPIIGTALSAILGIADLAGISGPLGLLLSYFLGKNILKGLAYLGIFKDKIELIFSLGTSLGKFVGGKEGLISEMLFGKGRAVTTFSVLGLILNSLGTFDSLFSGSPIAHLAAQGGLIYLALLGDKGSATLLKTVRKEILDPILKGMMLTMSEISKHTNLFDVFSSKTLPQMSTKMKFVKVFEDISKSMRDVLLSSFNQIPKVLDYFSNSTNATITNISSILTGFSSKFSGTSGSMGVIGKFLFGRLGITILIGMAMSLFSSMANASEDAAISQKTLFDSIKESITSINFKEIFSGLPDSFGFYSSITLASIYFFKDQILSTFKLIGNIITSDITAKALTSSVQLGGSFANLAQKALSFMNIFKYIDFKTVFKSGIEGIGKFALAFKGVGIIASSYFLGALGGNLLGGSQLAEIGGTAAALLAFHFNRSLQAAFLKVFRNLAKLIGLSISTLIGAIAITVVGGGLLYTWLFGESGNLLEDLQSVYGKTKEIIGLGSTTKTSDITGLSKQAEAFAKERRVSIGYDIRDINKNNLDTASIDKLNSRIDELNTSLINSANSYEKGAEFGSEERKAIEDEIKGLSKLTDKLTSKSAFDPSKIEESLNKIYNPEPIRNFDKIANNFEQGVLDFKYTIKENFLKAKLKVTFDKEAAKQIADEIRNLSSEKGTKYKADFKGLSKSEKNLSELYKASTMIDNLDPGLVEKINKATSDYVKYTDELARTAKTGFMGKYTPTPLSEQARTGLQVKQAEALSSATNDIFTAYKDLGERTKIEEFNKQLQNLEANLTTLTGSKVNFKELLVADQASLDRLKEIGNEAKVLNEQLDKTSDIGQRGEIIIRIKELVTRFTQEKNLGEAVDMSRKQFKLKDIMTKAGAPVFSDQVYQRMTDEAADKYAKAYTELANKVEDLKTKKSISLLSPGPTLEKAKMGYIFKQADDVGKAYTTAFEETQTSLKQLNTDFTKELTSGSTSSLAMLDLASRAGIDYYDAIRTKGINPTRKAIVDLNAMIEERDTLMQSGGSQESVAKLSSKIERLKKDFTETTKEAKSLTSLLSATGQQITVEDLKVLSSTDFEQLKSALYAVSDLEEAIQKLGNTVSKSEIDKLVERKMRASAIAFEKLSKVIYSTPAKMLQGLSRVGVTDNSLIKLLPDSTIQDLFQIDSEITSLQESMKDPKNNLRFKELVGLLDQANKRAISIKENVLDFAAITSSFAKSITEGMTTGAKAAFEKFKALSGQSGIEFKDFIKVPRAQRQISIENLGALDALSKIGDLPQLTEEQTKIFNKLAEGADPLSVYEQLQKTMQDPLTAQVELQKEIKKGIENTNAILTTGKPLPSDTKTLPTVDVIDNKPSTSGTQRSDAAYQAIDDARLKENEQFYKTLQSNTTSSLRKLKLAFIHYGQTFEETWLNASDAQAKAAIDLVSKIGETNALLDSDLISDDTRRLLKKSVDDYNDQLDKIKEKLDEVSMKKAAEDAGKAFSSDVSSGFKDGIKDLVKGKSTFKEFTAGMLDKVTGSITDTFIEGLTKPLTEKAGGMISDLGKGVFSAGSATFSSLFGDKSFLDSFSSTFGQYTDQGVSANTAETVTVLQRIEKILLGQDKGGDKGNRLAQGTSLFAGLSSQVSGLVSAGSPTNQLFGNIASGFDPVSGLWNTSPSTMMNFEGAGISSNMADLSAVSGMPSKIGDSASAMESAFTPKFASMADTFETNMASSVGESSSIFSTISDSFSSLFSKGGDLLSGIGESFGSVFGSLTDGLSSLMGSLGGSLGDIGSSIMGAFSSMGGFFADGGRISGPGTGTSDSIMAMVSNGEFVVNAAATKEHLGLLQALNSGKTPKFATGGLIGDTSTPVMLQPNMVDIKPAASANSSGSQQIVNLTITGDISRQTKAEIYKMLPNIAEGVNNHNKERGYRR